VGSNPAAPTNKTPPFGGVFDSIPETAFGFYERF
jgi:hypothetical protein